MKDSEEIVLKSDNIVDQFELLRDTISGIDATVDELFEKLISVMLPDEKTEVAIDKVTKEMSPFAHQIEHLNASAEDSLARIHRIIKLIEF